LYTDGEFCAFHAIDGFFRTTRCDENAFSDTKKWLKEQENTSLLYNGVIHWPERQPNFIDLK